MVRLPCGQCIGCRLERSRQWAIRCVHEAQLHENNSFITLTYNDQHLPHDGSLAKEDFQKFMKRLRKQTGAKVRYFHCGEYGPKLGRPHYHACLFGFDFDDRVLFKSKPTPLYVSEQLMTLWPFGFSTVGNVTFESAAYVARYIMKKITGDQAMDHYWKTDEITGEAFKVQPEYTTMSRKPGIAAGWYEHFKSDVFPRDELILNATKMRPPRFYDSRYEIEDPDGYEKVKRARVKRAKEHASNNTPERLAVREKCKQLQLRKLKRGYENAT